MLHHDPRLLSLDLRLLYYAFRRMPLRLRYLLGVSKKDDVHACMLNRGLASHFASFLAKCAIPPEVGLTPVQRHVFHNLLVSITNKTLRLVETTKMATRGSAVVVQHYRVEDGADFVSFVPRQTMNSPHWEAYIFGRATTCSPPVHFRALDRIANRSISPAELGLLTENRRCTIDIQTHQNGHAFNVVTTIVEGQGEKSMTERYHLLGCMEVPEGKTYWIYASNTENTRLCGTERARGVVPAIQRC